jgi:hypothetical protein
MGVGAGYQRSDCAPQGGRRDLEKLRRELSEDHRVEFCMPVGHYVMASDMKNVAIEPA